MADGDKEIFDTMLSLRLGFGGGSSSVGDITGGKKNEAYHSDTGGEAGTRKKKLKLTADQLNVLDHTFNRQKNIDQAQKDELAGRLNLTTRQVEIWFQNRRARQKQQETGREYDRLKEKYEDKKAENIELKQRLQLALALTGDVTPVIATLQALQICPTCINIIQQFLHHPDNNTS